MMSQSCQQLATPTAAPSRQLHCHRANQTTRRAVCPARGNMARTRQSSIVVGFGNAWQGSETPAGRTVTRRPEEIPGWNGFERINERGISLRDFVAERCRDVWEGPVSAGVAVQGFEIRRMSGCNKELASPDIVLYDPETGLPRALIEVRLSNGPSTDPGLMQLILYGRQLMSPLPQHSSAQRVRRLALVSIVLCPSSNLLVSATWESRADTPDADYHRLRADLRREADEGGRGFVVKARDVIFRDGIDIKLSQRIEELNNTVPSLAALRNAKAQFPTW